MKEKLIRLHNTLLDIETKGGSTVTMGDCLKYLSQLISECDEAKNNSETGK